MKSLPSNAAMSICRRAALLLLVGASAISCRKLSTPEITLNDVANVKITTRATGNNSLEYPINVCAFDAHNGLLVHHNRIDNSDGEVMLPLTRDEDYRIVAYVANSSHYVVPTELTLTAEAAVVGPSKEAYAVGSALQIGSEDMTPTTDQHSIEIGLSYAVSSLNVTVKELPDDASAVTVALTAPCTKFALNGTISQPKTVTIPLSKNTDTGYWGVTSVYILPSVEGQTATLELSYTIDGVVHKASTVYDSGFRAGVPYSFNATYDSKLIQVQGVITAPEWAAEVSIPLTFEKDNGTNAGGGNNNNAGGDENDAYTVDAIPAIGDIWDGHIVAAVTGDDASATLLLLSKKRWDNVKPANAEDGTNVDEIISDYSEGDLEDWTLPTDAQAQAISNTYLNNGSKLINAMNSVQADALNALNANYLCGDGTRKTTFNTGTISNTSRTATYSVRLVKEVQVQKK